MDTRETDMKSSPRWDGTDLGKWNRGEVQLAKIQFEGDTFIQLSFPFSEPDQTEPVESERLNFWALCRRVKDKFCCIADELKCVFGFVKLGTHTITLNSKLYLLIRPVISQCNIVCPPHSPQYGGLAFCLDIPLDQLSLHPYISQNSLFKRQIQEIFAFRELIGLKSSPRSEIRVRFSNRGPKGYYYPISFYDSINLLETEEIALPGTVITRWFGGSEGIPVRDVIERILCLKGEDVQRDEIIARYRLEIEKVVLRIDKEFVWIIVYIIDRILRSL